MVLDSDGDVLFSNMCGRHDVRLCVEQLLSSGQICIVAMIPAYATQALPGFDRCFSTFILQCTSEQVGIFPTMSADFWWPLIFDPRVTSQHLHLYLWDQPKGWYLHLYLSSCLLATRKNTIFQVKIAISCGLMPFAPQEKMQSLFERLRFSLGS